MAVHGVARGVRGVIALLTLIAAVMMLCASQSVKRESGWAFTVRYYNFGGFLIFMIAYFVLFLYSLVTAFLPDGKSVWIAVHDLDWVMAILTFGSTVSAWTYYNILNKGNVTVPWAPICLVTPRFCSSVLGALVTGAIGLSVHCIFIAYSCLAIYGKI